MGTGILIGMVLCLLLEGLVLLAVRAWRQTLPPLAPQPPQTPAQLANQAVYEAQTRHHPRVVSMTFRRRTRRGRALTNVEEDTRDLEG